MADDAHMPIKSDHRRRDGGFADIAREELSVTARAFFAPVVGAVHIVRGLLSDKHDDPGPVEPEPVAPEPPKKRRAA
jgi:hypothetical protein